MTAAAAPARPLAPLLVGVTGKLDLHGAEAAVRAALDLAFDRLDVHCPTTPKVLLSSLARGADTIAAEAALARPGWSVVAPLPFSEALYLEDFEPAAGERLRSLLAHPKLRPLNLPPLRRARGGEPFQPAELTRAAGEPNDARTEHYEQAGLFVAERSAILLAVMEAVEAPGKVGGSARIVRHRLAGELDEIAASIERRSDILLDPVRLVDRRTGPVWLVDLARLLSDPGAPMAALMAWAPDDKEPQPLGDNEAARETLRLADGLEALNRSTAKISPHRWRALEKRAGPHGGDAASEVRLARLALSSVQGDMTGRVKRSIWLLALLSFAAILSFEIYIDLSALRWTRWFSIAYAVLVALAIGVYWHAIRSRWQRIAEDYRAAAEALRVQLVWWSAGLTGREDRVERHYLRGAHGSMRQLRVFVDHVIDAALLRFGPPPTDPAAAEAWVGTQITYFEDRIKARRGELALAEGASWFLFATSISMGLALALAQIDPILEAVLAFPVAWEEPIRIAGLVAGVGLFAGLLLAAVRRRLKSEEASVAPSGLLGGFALALGLAVLGAIAAGGAPPDERLEHAMHWTKELIAMAVILPAAIAGALRYVADKSSWAAELSGYEHAVQHFRRGAAALAGARDMDEIAEHRELIRALGAEALSENEAWLRSHRERPLEPVVGG